MKYIIDIPDDTSYLNIVKLSEGCVAKVKTVYIPDLTPYTEPDTKAIEDEAKKNLYNTICKKIRREIFEKEG